jgi:outer membrane protein assembly factor BamA
VRYLFTLLIGWLLPLGALSQALTVVDGQGQVLTTIATNDSLQQQQALSAFLRSRWAAGYLTASLYADSADSSRFYYHEGESYQWLQLEAGSGLSQDWLRELGFKARYFANKNIDPAAFEKLTESVLTLAANKGFPFARLQFDSLQWQGNALYGRLTLDRGPQIRYGDIRIAGDAPVSKRFLRQYLGIETGKVYAEKQLNAFSRRLSALPYLRETEVARVYYFNNQTDIYLYTAKRAANAFDGMLGVFPNSNNGRLQLMGDLNLQLWSIFKQGEQFALQFRSLQQGTQDLKLHINWPFLFRTPLGLDEAFSLFRRDTTFLEIQNRFSLQYPLDGADWLRVFVDNRVYNLINNTNRGDLANVNGRLYGIAYQRYRLNDILLPSRGWRMLLSLAAGERRLPATENSEALRYVQYQIQTEASVYWRWHRRWILVNELHSQHQLSDALRQNEMYRLGGFKSLKGFDEASLLAAQYAFLNVEQRFLLDANSWLYAFWNGGWLRYASSEQRYDDRPYGLGLGLTFSNNSGLFSLAYALGSERGNPLRLNAAKVHLGYRYLL